MDEKSRKRTEERRIMWKIDKANNEDQQE